MTGEYLREIEGGPRPNATRSEADWLPASRARAAADAGTSRVSCVVRPVPGYHEPWRLPC